MMIRSFADKNAEAIFDGERVKRMALDLQKAIRRKLKYLNNAESPTDLRIPPSNHFEALAGRNGYYSIRVNDQWRLTFSWSDGAENVAIEDYH